jgi:hypothetical protein
MNTNTFIVRYRKWLIIVPIIITLAIIIPLTKAKINPDLMKYLPDDIEAKINNEKIEAIFGKYEPVIAIFKANDVLNETTLERIKSINDALKESAQVADIISLFETKYIRGEDGSMLVDPAIREIPTTETEREKLRNELISNPLAFKLVVSDDFNYSSIIINPTKGIDDATIIETITKIIDDFPGEEQVYINGLPYLRHEIQVKATRDIAILMPIGLLVMLIILYLSFRERRGVLLPFIVVLMSIALAMGLMPLFGYDLSMIAVLIPIMMIAIANNYGVHIVARYQELNTKNPTWSMTQIVSECIKRLGKPIVLTGLTTIIGVMGLIVHLLIPAKQMGIVGSIAIGFALLLSLLFIPAIMMGMKKGKPIKLYESGKKGWIDQILSWSARITTKMPLVVIYGFASVVIIAGIGIFNLQVSVNLEKMMPKSHPMRISTTIANEEFGGTKHITILFEGDILEPEVMQTMDKFENELLKIEGVGATTSLAKVVKLISKSLNEPGEEFYNVIPNDRQAIAQYIEFYNMSGNPEDFEKLVDFEFTHAILNVQFNAKDMREFNRIQSSIENLVNSSPYTKLIAGQCLVEKQLANSIVIGQIYSLIFALLAIAILLWIIFKSLTAGLMGSIPLLVALICNFGLMGWFGIELDIGNSLLSSIAIGLGVDYTIHLFWRLKYELSLGKELDEAIHCTLITTGRGVAINAFSVMVGFAVLFFSGLVILKSFAFLIIFSILLCLLCALILIPAISIVTKPQFLKKNGDIVI